MAVCSPQIIPREEGLHCIMWAEIASCYRKIGRSTKLDSNPPFLSKLFLIRFFLIAMATILVNGGRLKRELNETLALQQYFLGRFGWLESRLLLYLDILIKMQGGSVWGGGYIWTRDQNTGGAMIHYSFIIWTLENTGGLIFSAGHYYLDSWFKKKTVGALFTKRGGGLWLLDESTGDAIVQGKRPHTCRSQQDCGRLVELGRDMAVPVRRFRGGEREGRQVGPERGVGGHGGCWGGEVAASAVVFVFSNEQRAILFFSFVENSPKHTIPPPRPT